MTQLSDLEGNRWSGASELWLDPLGDQVTRCEAHIEVAASEIRYEWSYEGKPQQGRVTLEDDGARFRDSWHQPEPMTCRRLQGARGLFQVEGSYGPEQDWGWRIGLFLRAPSKELVLQMTNIAPWGEEVRAVRMTFTKS